MDVFVARQAIFDRDSRVYAYELLYRSNAERNEFTGSDEDLTTLDVMASGLLNIGLTSIADGKKAFINFGRNLLVEGLVSLLPKNSVVIEVLETTEPDYEVINRCRKLRDEGYTIALDDFVWDARFEDLIATANIIKVDMRLTSKAEQERLVTTYKPRGLKMLAEKVETREEFEWAVNLGYDYFQGYFFSRPAIVSRKEIQPVVATCLEVLHQLQTPELNLKILERLIGKDVSLTYKLFRYVNSVIFSHEANFQSIRSALVHLGEDGIRRWAPVATLLRAPNTKPEELVACAMLRARFSENLALLAGDPRSSSAYLIGMFSLLDAMLDKPLKDALNEAGLAPAMQAVLLGSSDADPTLTTIYTLMSCYETGKWDNVKDAAQSLRISNAAVANAYVDSVRWANEIVQELRASESSTAPKPVVRSKERRRRGKRDPITAPLVIIWGRNTQEEFLAQANLVDISAHGARFRSAAPVPVGAWLVFNHHKVGVNGRGRVRYSRLTKGMFDIGVDFASGTGWDAAVNRFSAHLRALSVAIDQLQMGKTPRAADAADAATPAKTPGDPESVKNDSERLEYPSIS